MANGPTLYEPGFKASRDPVARITDETLLRPLRNLTPAERAMIRRAINSPQAGEFAEQVRGLHPDRHLSPALLLADDLDTHSDLTV